VDGISLWMLTAKENTSKLSVELVGDTVGSKKVPALMSGTARLLNMIEKEFTFSIANTLKSVRSAAKSLSLIAQVRRNEMHELEELFCGVTKKQFAAYEKVRVSGLTNMWDRIAVEELSCGIVGPDAHLAILRKYENLDKHWPEVREDPYEF